MNIIMENIIEYYKKLPEHGLYDNKLKTLESFIPYFKDKTKDLPDLICLKKKLELEKRNKTDTIEYKIVSDKLKQIGIEYKNIGENFEKNSFENIKQFVKKYLQSNNLKGNFTIHKNKTLYEKKDEEWHIIGEVDVIVILEEKGINYILFIGEIKHNFDDIPDAFYQINRSYQLIKNKNNNVRMNNKILDESYVLFHQDIFETSIIVSNFDPENNKYFDIQSKLKFMILMMIGIYNPKPKKILKKVSKKQKNNRYTKSVLNIINNFKKNNLIDRILF